MVGLEGIKHIAHTGCATLGGEDIIFCLVVTPAHSPAQIVAGDYLRIFQDTWWRGVMVADYAIYKFIYKIISIRFQVYGHIIVEMAEHFGGYIVAVLVEKLLETLCHSPFCGRSHYTEVIVKFIAVGLFHGKLSEQEECFARIGEYPVGVTSPRVEKCSCGALCVLFGKFYKCALDFKGAHLRKFLLQSSVFRVLDDFVHKGNFL